MKKYTFSEKVGKKTTKHEIVADSLEDAQAQLTEQLESDRGISIVDVGLPDYIEPIDPPTDITLKTYNITFWEDPDESDKSTTVTYKALSLNSAEGQFLEDYPDQAGKARETHMPLSNYEADRKNAEIMNEKTKSTEEPIADKKGLFDKLFTQATDWAKILTGLFIGLIGLGLVSSVLFGVDGGFGIVTNISNLFAKFEGLTGLIVLFLIYYLFIRSGKEET